MLRYLNAFEGFFAPFILTLMTIVAIAQVFFRYVVSYSLDWPEELGRYLFIVSIYLGASLAERHDRHLAVTVLRISKNKFVSRLACLSGPFFTVVFSVLMVVWGIQMTFFVYETEQLAPAMQFPMFYAYAVIPFGMFCMGIHSVVNFCKVLGVLKNTGENTLNQPPQ